MKTCFLKKIILLIGVICLPAFCLANNPIPMYLGINEAEQKRLDLLPGSIYLYPQAFADNANSITTVKLRVCVDWSDASQAAFGDVLMQKKNVDSDFDYAVVDPNQVIVPYRFTMAPTSRRYIQYAQPPVCRRFQEVVIPTGDTILKAIRANVDTYFEGTYISLSKVDADLDLRIKSLMSDKALQTLRQAMEAKVKEEILSGPFTQEVTEKIYKAVKADLEREKAELRVRQ